MPKIYLMNNFLDPVELSLASKGLRFTNFLIDYILFIVIYFVFRNYFSNLLGLIYWGNGLIQLLIDWFFYFAFMTMQEFLFKGRTIGKFITGTKAVTINGTEPHFGMYAIRSLCRMVPFELISFLGETGWHDTWSKTRVVNIKEFEQNQTKFNSIDQIGTHS